MISGLGKYSDKFKKGVNAQSYIIKSDEYKIQENLKLIIQIIRQNGQQQYHQMLRITNTWMYIMMQHGLVRQAIMQE